MRKHIPLALAMEQAARLGCKNAGYLYRETEND